MFSCFIIFCFVFFSDILLLFYFLNFVFFVRLCLHFFLNFCSFLFIFLPCLADLMPLEFFSGFPTRVTSLNWASDNLQISFLWPEFPRATYHHPIPKTTQLNIFCINILFYTLLAPICIHLNLSIIAIHSYMCSMAGSSVEVNSYAD